MNDHERSPPPNDSGAEPAPQINRYANVVVMPNRIAFEGDWAFAFPDTGAPIEPTVEVQAQISLLMIQWAIGQLAAAQARIAERLGLLPTTVVVPEIWTPEKQAAWEAMTPDERYASLGVITGAHGGH